MITAVSEATVPKICVVVRKAYGAGLYAMAGPGFEPDATLALPTARIAVMGPEPAVNAVFFNKIQTIDDPDERERFVAEKRAEYEKDIDLLHLASENVIDAVVQPDELRAELVRRIDLAANKERFFSTRRHGVPPVLRATSPRSRPKAKSVSSQSIVPTVSTRSPERLRTNWPRISRKSARGLISG
jgi:acetyl-CoA carboxylase carboxyltransferase component